MSNLKIGTLEGAVMGNLSTTVRAAGPQKEVPEPSNVVPFRALY